MGIRRCRAFWQERLAGGHGSVETQAIGVHLDAALASHWPLSPWYLAFLATDPGIPPSPRIAEMRPCFACPFAESHLRPLFLLWGISLPFLLTNLWLGLVCRFLLWSALPWHFLYHVPSTNSFSNRRRSFGFGYARRDLPILSFYFRLSLGFKASESLYNSNQQHQSS